MDAQLWAARLPLSRAAAQRAGLGPLRHVASTGSTNGDLAAEARRGATAPAVLVADHQTEGRGRLDRRWRDSGTEGTGDGSLLVSLRLPGPAAAALDRAAAVSAAALEVSAAAVGDVAAWVRAKWPNDLLIESDLVAGKLAGVLSEIVMGDTPAVVVGLGLNIAPVSGVPGAASLAEAGSSVTRDELLAGLLDRLPAYLSDPSRARAALRSSSATIGRAVRVEQADGTSLTGTARSIDDSGRLVVDVGGAEHRINAGDVVHLRHP